MAPSKTARAATARAVNGSPNEQLRGQLNAQNTKFRLKVQSFVHCRLPPTGAELIAQLAWGRP
jgi:hypothetical protein